jgi:hypothetical protein
MQDWITNYPAMFAMQQQYAPQEAAQQVALAQQYAQPMGEAMKTAQEAMYPQETALSNQLNQQVQQGMGSQVPDWMQQQYRSDVNANLGTNVGSGIGADYVSRGLLQQQQDWQNYYRNLGLSITGRQPIATATTPNYSNYASQFTPNSVMGYNAQNYGTSANIYGNQLSSSGGNFGGLGAGLGMLAGGLLAIPTGGMSIPMGAMIGGGVGGGVGSMFKY